MEGCRSSFVLQQYWSSRIGMAEKGKGDNSFVFNGEKGSHKNHFSSIGNRHKSWLARQKAHKRHEKMRRVALGTGVLNSLHNMVLLLQRIQMNAAKAHTWTHTALLPKEAYFNYNGCHGYFNFIIAPSSLATETSSPLIRNLV